MAKGRKRQRLDAEMVRRGLAPSRTQAAELISGGHVTVGGQTAQKPATQVELASAIVVTKSAPQRYASRGAHKLLGALEAYPDFAVADRVCLDAGASTGGFTDVLLRRDAKQVFAVDVGYGQLVWALQNDERVVVMDRTNVRHLTSANLPTAPEVIVSDVSFISLTLLIPALAQIAAAEADWLLMVKPQFEVGKERIGAGGVVRSPDLRAESVIKVATCAQAHQLHVLGAAASPLPGPAGNVEYFLRLSSSSDGPGVAEPDLAAMAHHAVAHGPQGAENPGPQGNTECTDQDSPAAVDCGDAHAAPQSPTERPAVSNDAAEPTNKVTS